MSGYVSKRSAAFDCGGRATDGGRYKSIAEMWESEAGDSSTDWYTKSSVFWTKQAASVEGMLGGMGHLHNRDIIGSRKFLAKAMNASGLLLPDDSVAIDVGSGIGRVAQELLLPLFREVDMLEQNMEYLERSKVFINDEDGHGEVVHRIACGMQDFSPNVLGDATCLRGRYHVIWIQWCIIYLTDDDLISFLKVCAECLAPDGIICLKDNLARAGFLVDKEDSSISRSDRYLKALFRKAELELVMEQKQSDFPKTIFPVKMYALRPKSQSNAMSNHADIESPSRPDCSSSVSGT